MNRTFDLLAALPLELEKIDLEPHRLELPSGIERLTTVVRMTGLGKTGSGEDVTYDAEDQIAFREQWNASEFSGRFTLRELSARLDTLSMWPRPPKQPAYSDYRRWAFESAALDLALRQAGVSLASALDRKPRPVRFVFSAGLGDPPDLTIVERRLAQYPWLRFKLDATPAWTEQLICELRATRAIDVVDLKGAYRGTPVDQPADGELYERVATGLPQALLEDPQLTPATRLVLEPHMKRVTWDAPIHSRADIEALEQTPTTINFKPSRFGTLQRLFDAYDHCAAHGIAIYGGGQFELSVGRGQIQVLAALLHGDAPNDVAPIGFTLESSPAELPGGPLRLDPAVTGFRWRV